jgi:heme-degrading monooxygenase HmoA
MYARVTFGNFRLDKVDETTKVVRDSILPVEKKLKGFKGLYQLFDRKTASGMTITLWDTEANMMAVESSGQHKENIDKAAALFSSVPTVERYEVTVEG